MHRHVPRFEPGDVEALAHLREQGYVVFAGVLSPEECEEVVDLLFGWLHEVTAGAVEQGQPATFHRWPPGIGRTGILPYCGIGQSEAQWRVRTAPRARAAFASLWGTQDLITSFDGACLFRPWRVDEAWKTEAGWFHVDQHPGVRIGFECIQGLVNLLEMNEGSGGNVLVPGSHLDFGKLAKRHPQEVASLPVAEDFFRIPATDPLLADPRGILQPHLQVGDLLCWDSRTVHCNQPSATGESVSGRHALSRAVSLVCMVPRSKASEEVLQARRGAVSQQVTTAHRPHVYLPSHEYDDCKRKAAEGIAFRYPAAPAEMDLLRWSLVGQTLPGDLVGTAPAVARPQEASMAEQRA